MAKDKLTNEVFLMEKEQLLEVIKEKYLNGFLVGAINFKKIRRFYNEKFGEIGWFLEEGAFLEIVSNGEFFWEEILPFLKSFNIEDNIFSELLRFQKFVIRLPEQEYLSAEFEYDFYSYFKTIISSYQHLKKEKICNGSST